ncbi:MAG: ATP-binding cassette domain-containing protein [Bacteroidia bacterium]|nr:ATP-binding cassette domain-containing protein [Bacteroidia bacterium]
MMEASLHKTLVNGKRKFQVQLELQAVQGELIALYGPSGAGKTTMLRLLAGLETADQGKMVLQGKTIFEAAQKIRLGLEERKTGMVFQETALFPNMTVQENLEFALRKGQNKAEIAPLLEIMDIGELKARRPENLSGGEKKRVDLARALVSRPDLLLLDEPFSALDPAMRSRMQDYLLRIQAEFNLITVLVSHDLGEIFRLARRVYEVKEGKIIRGGKPWDLFGKGEVSGKFRFTGIILQIESADLMQILTLMVGSQPVKVVITPSLGRPFQVGEEVMVVSKAFSPMVFRLDEKED